MYRTRKNKSKNSDDKIIGSTHTKTMAHLFSMDRPNQAIDDVFQSNQQTLKTDIEEYVQDDKLRAKMNSITKREKGHGRIEIRTAFTTNDVS